MRIAALTSLPADAAEALVRHFSDHTDAIADARFGEDVPTKMIFAPERSFPASLHYMFFPRGTCQDFHWHPGGRHLVVLGDTPLTVRTNDCDTDTDPYENATSHEVPAFTVAAIRFGAETWHEFSSCGESGLGIVAFTFHDSDDLISASVTLMEDLTTFWPSPPVVKSA